MASKTNPKKNVKKKNSKGRLVSISKYQQTAPRLCIWSLKLTKQKLTQQKTSKRTRAEKKGARVKMKEGDGTQDNTPGTEA